MHYAGDLRKAVSQDHVSHNQVSHNQVSSHNASNSTASRDSDSQATKGLDGVRNAMQRAREEWTDAERRIRQRMRVYPQKLRNLMTRSTDEAGLEVERHTVKAVHMGGITPQPTPIVSINGHDVDGHHVDEGERG